MDDVTYVAQQDVAQGSVLSANIMVEIAPAMTGRFMSMVASSQVVSCS
jgi:hypothetical protein